MKILNIDITGKVSVYDDSLYESILAEDKDNNDILCLTPFKSYCSKENNGTKLSCFVPEGKTYSKGVKKRLFKILEAFVNYARTFFIIKKNSPNVLHLQWLPFLEFCSIEYYILRLFKLIRKNMKIVLTVHNIYPHDLSSCKKIKFQNRFKKIVPLIDGFIVHTNSSIDNLEFEFGIPNNRISVIKHGAFIPHNIPIRKRQLDNRTRFLMFGTQSLYKGTDMLLNAIDSLPNNIVSNIELHIVGLASNDIAKMIQCHHNKNVNWINEYVTDDILYQEIVDSDVLVFPYRNISQSGALLLGLSFQKPIIVSDLPSFTETLKGYNKDMFFKTGDVDDLKRCILSYLSSDENYKDNIALTLKYILNENSWKKSAKDTLSLYQRLVKMNC